MGLAEGRLSRLTLALVGIVTLGCGIILLLPQDIVIAAIKVLTAWLVLSLPIGVFVGHCMPRDADRC